MAKPEWGTKRTCLKCGERFYDLKTDYILGTPITCIACGTEWTPEAILKTKQPIVVQQAAKEKEDEASSDDDDDIEDIDIDDDDDDALSDVSLDDDDDTEVSAMVDTKLATDSE